MSVIMIAMIEKYIFRKTLNKGNKLGIFLTVLGGLVSGLTVFEEF